MNKLSQLIKTGKTVFAVSELVDIWQTNRDTVKATVYRMIQQRNLKRLKRGLFALSDRIDLFELGCKLVFGSYVSCFTVLKEEGVIFQEYKNIYLVAPRPQTIVIEENSFEYHTISALTSLPDGIEFRDYYSIACLERALLDTFCIFHADYSDFKISSFNKEKFLQLSVFYNERTQKTARQFLKDLSL